ncbi:sulfatase-like hydrolase/transferase [Haloferax sp. AB510]|uniref:sulfatase-like hydrolase/transferase n=1 Tax=Haloferax sp. AB510 TaxID=2934172 RepID=UPI00209C5900|nr:sulfatase-like hydrolase/transferase [Haloferax sp. AB510]MCO8266127.1 sulfatase-like hydrolase/transferase [Haloferax sp. AB510]
MRSVVLICLDTVRKDYFDRYARRIPQRADVSFEECRAASSWSVPSHASIMLESLPHRHGVHDYNRGYDGIDPDDTFLSRLPDHESLGASANVYASSAFGFNELFDEFLEVSPDRRYPKGIHVGRFGYDFDGDGIRKYLGFIPAALTHDYPVQSFLNGASVGIERMVEKLPVPTPFDDGAKIISKVGADAVERTDGPFFLFTNFMEAHAPHRAAAHYDSELYSAPNTWDSSAFDKWDINLGGEAGLEANEKHVTYYRELYGAAIEYLDRQVSAFMDRVQAAADHEVTFIVTGDHGENLGKEEDGYLLGHDSSLSEGLVHVPCYIVNPPEGYDEFEDELFSHLGLGELIVGLANDETPDVFEDRISAELVGSTNASPPEDAEYWTRMLRSVYLAPDEKIVWDSLGTGLRYERRADGDGWREVGETDEFEVLDEALFDVPIAEYQQSAAAGEQSADVHQATRDRLEELGYL